MFASVVFRRTILYKIINWGCGMRKRRWLLKVKASVEIPAVSIKGWN